MNVVFSTLNENHFVLKLTFNHDQLKGINLCRQKKHTARYNRNHVYEV